MKKNEDKATEIDDLTEIDNLSLKMSNIPEKEEKFVGLNDIYYIIAKGLIGIMNRQDRIIEELESIKWNTGDTSYHTRNLK